MVKKEQIIMWGSVLLVIIVLGLAFSGGENNYLNPSGNRNPANQKLMVVDQDTGEISFIQKSLQGVNQQIVADDTVILNILKNLLGDNLNNYAEYTKSGSNGVINQLKLDVIDRRVRDIAGVRGRLDKLETFMNEFLGNNSNTGKQMRDALFNKIDNGDGFIIQLSKSTYGHGANTWDNRSGYGYRAITGFRDNKTSGEPGGGWNNASADFSHSSSTAMRIIRQNTFK